ncbi:MAG: DUF4286 family protein [Leeuwenhoekiella sp.]
MIIHNITLNIDDSIHQQGLVFLKDEFIPQMLDTGFFYKALMTRVNVNEEMGGQTYSVQFRAESWEALQKFKTEKEARMLVAFNRFGDKIVMFATELEVVLEQEV